MNLLCSWFQQVPCNLAQGGPVLLYFRSKERDLEDLQFFWLLKSLTKNFQTKVFISSLLQFVQDFIDVTFPRTHQNQEPPNTQKVP